MNTSAIMHPMSPIRIAILVTDACQNDLWPGPVDYDPWVAFDNETQITTKAMNQHQT